MFKYENSFWNCSKYWQSLINIRYLFKTHAVENFKRLLKNNILCTILLYYWNDYKCSFSYLFIIVKISQHIMYLHYYKFEVWKLQYIINRVKLHSLHQSQHLATLLYFDKPNNYCNFILPSSYFLP